MTQRISHCHKRIRDVARGLAEATYDNLMSSSNFVYEGWKKKHPGLNAQRLRIAFVNKYWGSHIPAARATLALALREPIDEKVKEEIMEILTLDATLARGRKDPAIVAGQVQQKI